MQYLQLFKIFKDVRGDIVTGYPGVLGFFAFPPYSVYKNGKS